MNFLSATTLSSLIVGLGGRMLGYSRNFNQRGGVGIFGAIFMQSHEYMQLEDCSKLVRFLYYAAKLPK